MSKNQDVPRLPVGMVINGRYWDGSQFRCLGGICGPDPRLFVDTITSTPSPFSLEEEFTAIMDGSVGSCGVRPTPEDT